MEIELEPAIGIAEVMEQLVGATGAEASQFRVEVQSVGHEQVDEAVDVVVAADDALADADAGAGLSLRAEGRGRGDEIARSVVEVQPVRQIADGRATDIVEIGVHVVVDVRSDDAVAQHRVIESAAGDLVGVARTLF